MGWLAQHLGGLMAGGGGLTTVLLVVFKDSVREWWTEYHAKKRLEREERSIERGKGSNLENQLLQILKQDLSGNATLLAKLHDTMGDLRDIARSQAAVSAQILKLSEDILETQKWMKWKFGEPPH